MTLKMLETILDWLEKWWSPNKNNSKNVENCLEMDLKMLFELTLKDIMSVVMHDIDRFYAQLHSNCMYSISKWTGFLNYNEQY